MSDHQNKTRLKPVKKHRSLDRRYSKKSKARIGFIGAGWWATTYYMPQFQTRPDVELVSVCGLDPKVLRRCQRDFGFTHVTTDYREALRQNLDGVVVASPHALHAEHALAALRQDCHVMVEKPLTTNARTAHQVVAEARQRGLHVVVPCGWQYRPIGIEAKKLMDAKTVGKIEHVVCHMASPVKNLFSGKSFDFKKGAYVNANLSTWADPRISHGGYGHGQLPHAIGLQLWLTGLRPKSVFARMSNPGARVDMYDAIVVEYAGGVIGTIAGAATLPAGCPNMFQLDIRVFGEKGVLHLDVGREHLSLHLHKGVHTVIPLEPGGGAYNTDEPPHQFVELILGLTKENNSPGEVAMRAEEIIDAAYRSCRSHAEETV